MAELVIFNVAKGRQMKAIKAHKNFGYWTDMIPGHFFSDDYTDLLFYNSKTGSAAFYRSNGGGEMEEIRSIGSGGWRTGLKIVPGHFSGSYLTDLIFYDPTTGNVALYENDGDALMKEIKVIQGAMNKGFTHVTSRRHLLAYDANSGLVNRYDKPGFDTFDAKESEIKPRHWRKGWSHLIPINFEDGSLPEILFYDDKTGDAEFFNYDSDLELKLVNKLPGGWKKGLSHIVAARLNSLYADDLLFYDRSEGSAAIYWNKKKDAQFTEAFKVPAGEWRKTWDAIAPGRFSDFHPSGSDLTHLEDLAFYSAEDY